MKKKLKNKEKWKIKLMEFLLDQVTSLLDEMLMLKVAAVARALTKLNNHQITTLIGNRDGRTTRMIQD